MSSSQIGSTWTDAVNAPVKSNRTLGYFRANGASEWYEYILEKFLAYQKRTKITKAQFAASIQKDAGQLNRLLAGPGNWTIETVADLLLGMGERIKPASETIVGVRQPSIEEATTEADASELLGGNPEQEPTLSSIPKASNDPDFTKQSNVIPLRDSVGDKPDIPDERKRAML